MNIKDLYNILLSQNVVAEIQENEEELFNFIPELRECKGFDQKNDWHIYDVYGHTLIVLNYTPNILELRLAALFHDTGKPRTFTIDKEGIGHFHGHYIESKKIFDEFSDRNSIPAKIKKITSNLIYYHDLNISKLNEEELINLVNTFDLREMEMLFSLKKADLLGHNSKFHNYLDEINKQKERVLTKYKR